MADVLPRLLRRIEQYWGACKERLNYAMARDACRMGTGVRLIGNACVRNFHGKPGDIVIGDKTVILGEICTFCEGARVKIGEETYIGPESNVRAFESIEIGCRVQISFGVNIYDNNSHSTSAGMRYRHAMAILEKGHPRIVEDLETKPIVIEDDVWIGFGSTILKGVTIGRGAIVGACSVVTKDVPPMTIVVGNPPRPIGQARP